MTSVQSGSVAVNAGVMDFCTDTFILCHKIDSVSGKSIAVCLYCPGLQFDKRERVYYLKIHADQLYTCWCKFQSLTRCGY